MGSKQQTSHTPRVGRGPSIARWATAIELFGAGVLHLTIARKEFANLVPKPVPGKPDTVVVASGVAEMGLGAAFALAKRRRRFVSRVAAVFLTVVWWGNIWQWQQKITAFNLDTDAKRLGRVVLQPGMIAAALYGGRAPRESASR